MDNCVNCKQIIPSGCVRTEEEFSFEYQDFNDLLKKLDEQSVQLKSILQEKVDKKWIKESKPYITNYIQDLINQIELLNKKIIPETEKFQINSDIVVGEKTSLQLFNIIFKELSAIKKSLNNDLSSMYLI